MIIERELDRFFDSGRRRLAMILMYVAFGFCVLTGGVTAQQTYDPSKVDLTGDWVGTITHTNDRYSYTYDYVLTLKQVGTTVSGRSDANAHAANVAVSFEVKGQYSNETFRAKDGRMITSQDGSPNDLWCVKSMELKLVQGSPLRLEGSWKSKSQFDVFNPLGLINPRSTTQCAGGTISLTRENLPTPFTGTYGTVAYYDFRNNDYVKRNPRKSPPTYYLDFAKKNLNMYITKVYPEVSSEGKVFLTTVARLLQEKIEDRLNSNRKAFADLEDNSDSFLDFAYSTHYPAYCEAGWDKLPYEDRYTIFHSIDPKDKYNFNGFIVGTKLLFCFNYKKPAEPHKSNPVKDKLKNIWNQVKKP